MSDSVLRRIEDKLNTLIPKAQWLLSNYSSAGTRPCPPCVGGEKTAEAAATAPVFTVLDPEYWPFRDDETSVSFRQKLRQPEFIHFFESQGLGSFLKVVKVNPSLTANMIRVTIVGKGKIFKTLPENAVNFGKSETLKPLLVYTPETYVESLQKQSDFNEARFLTINAFIKKLILTNLDIYKPFLEMDKTMFAHLYAVFQNLYKCLQAGGCNSNEVLQKYLISKNLKDAEQETANITVEAKEYFKSGPYQQRQARRQAHQTYTGNLKYEPFEDFNEWNWVENDLKAAQVYYAQPERSNPDLYPFLTLEDWKNEFHMRTGGPMTTRNESLAAAKHYRDSGTTDETYPQKTLKEWNDARIENEGSRVILPSRVMPQTPDWCFVALTSLFTRHPYVINYFINNQAPIEIPNHVSKNLLTRQGSKNGIDASVAKNELSGKVIFAVLLNFVTTCKPLETVLPQILAGEITDPSSYDLFAAYLKQKPLPETPAEFMQQPQQAVPTTRPNVTASETTLPSLETLPETVGSTSVAATPRLNSLERLKLQQREPTLRQQLEQRSRLEPVTEEYGTVTKPLDTYKSVSKSDFGGLPLHRRHKSTRRHYTKSPIRPFY